MPAKADQKETLFAIGEHFYALESLIIENEGVIDDEIDQWLNHWKAKEHEKVDAYCYVIQKYESIAEEADRLAQRAKRYKQTVQDLKYRLKSYLEFRGTEKIETSRFSVKVTPNGGQIPVTLNDGITVDDLPAQFIKVIKEADMVSIREALVKGDSQAQAVAQFQPRGTHLRIK